MDDLRHSILCVDDEESILNSLTRVLRREGYKLFTASSGAEGLKILKKNDIQLVICDQKMPQMSGIEFLKRVKKQHPDAIRMTLTGYPDVDAITEAINRGQIYKFLLKPWDDHTLKREIREAFDQYEFVKANNRLHKYVAKQNQKLKKMNENLENKVKGRTRDLKAQNQAVELAKVIFEDLSVPIIGISLNGTILLLNREARCLPDINSGLKLGGNFNNCFSTAVSKKLTRVYETKNPQKVTGHEFSNGVYDMDMIPLSGTFSGKGAIVVLTKNERCHSTLSVNKTMNKGQ